MRMSGLLKDREGGGRVKIKIGIRCTDTPACIDHILHTGYQSQPKEMIYFHDIEIPDLPIGWEVTSVAVHQKAAQKSEKKEAGE